MRAKRISEIARDISMGLDDRRDAQKSLVLCADTIDAFLALIEALPKCMCGNPATKCFPRWKLISPKCDNCAETFATQDPDDLPYAAALRRLLAD